MKSHARALALVLSWLVSSLFDASLVRASPLLELTSDFGGLGGLSARTSATGASAAYFNPALLNDAPAGLSAGVLLLHSEIGVRVGVRGAASDVPDGLANASRSDGSRLPGYPIGSEILRNGRPAREFQPALQARPRQGAGSGHQTLSYEVLGMVAKLFHERLAVGFYGLIPNAPFLRVQSFYVDEREQYFSNSLHPELYADRLRALSLAFAAGLRVSPKLSLGAGASLGAAAAVDAPVFVADASRLQDILLNMRADARVAISPHGGFSYRPHPRLHLTGTLHAPQKVEIEAKFKFLLATGLEQGSSLKFVQGYQPWQAGAGAAWDLVQSSARTWSANCGVLYGRWSQYVDRHGARPDAPYAWRDTLTGALGLAVRAASFGLATHLQYKPTPVPEQTGRTNYVDSDRLGLSVSADLRWTWLDTPLSLAAQVQAYWLTSRQHQKLPTPTNAKGNNKNPQRVWDELPDDAEISGEPVAGREGLQTNNPGWPGFSSSGWLGSMGLMLSVGL